VAYARSGLYSHSNSVDRNLTVFNPTASVSSGIRLVTLLILCPTIAGAQDVSSESQLAQFTESYSYDAAGRLVEVVYSDTDKLTFGYDATGNLASYSAEIVTLTSVAASADLPEAFALLGNYPNPFNPSTTIRYDLPERTDVELSVVDVTGRQIALLVDAEQSAGFYSVSWDASDAGSNLASGVYFVRLRAGSFRQVARVVLMK